MTQSIDAHERTEIATDETLKTIERLAAQLERERAARIRSDNRLIDLLADTAMQEHNRVERQEMVEWMASVIRAVHSRPVWWGWLPPRWQRQMLTARLARRGLFDGKAYIRDYPDVAQAGMDPLLHYIMHGRHEGRKIG